MTAEVAICALLSAFCYAFGASLQQGEARREDGSPSMLLRLGRRPRWLCGLGINALGLVLQALALRHGPLVVVQPMLVLSMVFSAALTALARRETVGPREWGGTAAIAVGLAVFFVAGRPEAAAHEATTKAWLQALLVTGGTAAACAALARGAFAASLLGVCAGVLFGTAATFTKATVEALSLGLLPALHSGALWGMVVVTALAFYAIQRAFQAGPLVASFPALCALDPLTSSLLGAWLYGEKLQSDPLAVAGAVAGSMLMLVGIWELSHSGLISSPGAEARTSAVD
jgi:drug/metabolite transporter (DMT)-like permease